MSHKQAKREHRKQGHDAGVVERLPGSSSLTADHWRLPLQSAVPLRVLALYERGGITRRDVIFAYLAGETLGTSADRYLNGATSTREGAALFNRTARALAVLSYLPGGVPAGWGPFDAQALLAGFFGEEVARQHVEQARWRAFKVPPSQEPLRELIRRSHEPGGGVREPAAQIAYLTAPDEPPDEEALALALAAYLAVDHFLASWRPTRPQAQARAQEDFQQSWPLAPEPAPPDRGIAELGEAAFAQHMQAHYQCCLERLAEISVREPGRIGTLFAFARSSEAMRRAIYQHLAVLIACEQLFAIEDELPADQDYRELILVLTSLLARPAQTSGGDLT